MADAYQNRGSWTAERESWRGKDGYVVRHMTGEMDESVSRNTLA